MKTLGKYLGKEVEGLFGVELELEGRGLIEEGAPLKFWSAIHDGSLRGGVEYVFKEPLNIKEASNAFKYLRDKLEEVNAKPDFSFRTSMHVHINCLGLTYVQILNLIYLYLVIEPLLINFSGEERKHNRFCLGLRDAEGQLDYFEKMFREPRRGFQTLRGIRLGEVKYAALNIGRMLDIGTAEVRTMRATLDQDVFDKWLLVLKKLRDLAEQFEGPDAILSVIEQKGVKAFVEENWQIEGFLPDNWEAEVNYNISLSYCLPFEFSKGMMKKEKEGGFLAFLQEKYKGVKQIKNSRLEAGGFDKLVKQHGYEVVFGAVGIPDIATEENIEAICNGQMLIWMDDQRRNKLHAQIDFARGHNLAREIVDEMHLNIPRPAEAPGDPW